MNRIAGSRWNDSHGDAVRELIDRADSEMPEHINGLIADQWDGFDPWGSNIAAWFALEDACLATGHRNHPEYNNPTGHVDDEDMLTESFILSIMSGEITDDDIDTARSVMDRLDHGLRLAGKDY